MKSFEYLENEATADLAIVARGKTLKKAFENSAKAVSNAIVDVDSVDGQEMKFVNKKAKNITSLLYDFLEEIIFYLDTESLVFSKIEIKDFDEKNNELSAVFNGEVFDKKKHIPKNNVKAITYHEMSIKKKQDFFEIKFIVDL